MDEEANEACEGTYPGEGEEEQPEAVVVGDRLERERRLGGATLLLRPRRREDLHEVAHRHPVRRQLQKRLAASGSRLLRPRYRAAADPREHVHGGVAGAETRASGRWGSLVSGMRCDGGGDGTDRSG